MATYDLLEESASGDTLARCGVRVANHCGMPSIAPVTRDMFAMHTLFGREFALLPALVRGVRAGDEERAQIVAHHVSLLTTLLHEHHYNEDQSLWPRLLQRGSTNARAVVDLMLAQHGIIATLAIEINAELQAWRASSASARGEALADALDRMLPALAEHTRSEEERALPLVEKHLSAAEYEELGAKGAANMSPADLPVLVGMLMYEGGPDVLPRTLPSAIKEMAPQAFALHSERVHGTATPPRSTSNHEQEHGIAP
jgi:hemerythrin-like domain-containing protein